MNMKVLGIETTGEKVSIGVQEFEGPGVQGVKSSKEDIIELMKEKNIKLEEIDGIAVSIGPGSFTGMRVGLAVAKGLAISLNKPIVGIPVLDAFIPGIEEHFKMQKETARFHKIHTDNKLVSPIIDAKRERIYTAIYEFDTESFMWSRKSSFWVMRIDEFLESITEERLLVGNGVSMYGEQIKKANKKVCSIKPNIDFPTGEWVAQLGYERFARGERDSVEELDGIYV